MIYIIIAFILIFGLTLTFSAGRAVGKLEERAKSVIRPKKNSAGPKNRAEEVEFEEIKD